MTLTILGRRVRAERCDGLRDHWRVTADGVFCGLIHHDAANQWHTVPARKIGKVAPPVCHSPTCQLALNTLVMEAFT